MCISLQEAMQQINSTPAVLPAINSTSRMQAPFQERAFHSIGCTADDKFFVGCAVTINSILCWNAANKFFIGCAARINSSEAAPAVDSFYIDCAAAQTITITHHFPFYIYLYMDGLFSIKAGMYLVVSQATPAPSIIFGVLVCVAFALQTSILD